MRKRHVLLAAVVAGVSMLTWALAGPRDEQWKKVNQAVNKGLPRTAISELEPIIAGAIKDKAYPEAIKAIAKKIALEGNIQGNKPEERIKLMQAAIAKSPDEMKPVLDAILANWYWHFFQQNRWRFMQRTQTASSSGSDILTWSLPRILSEIDQQFIKALAADKVLKATPIGDYDALLEKGTVPDTYRPTLYDFIAHNALNFYASGEQAGARAEDAFVLTADSPIFETAEQFLGWKVETTDTDSITVRAIKLYQELLRFHQNDQDRTAFAAADLERLRFGYNQAKGETKNANYKAALEKFANRWQKHEIAAMALYQWAGILQNEGDLVEARRLAVQAAKNFPDSVGGKLAHNLVVQIEAKSANINTERVWTKPFPVIELRYRNITKMHFRAVAWDYRDRLQKAQYRPEFLTDQERQALLAKDPTHAWSVELEATSDYHDRVVKLPVPKELKAGFYFLIASIEPGFGAANNQVFFTDFFVSKLAMVVRVHQGEGVLEGFVLDAASGNPLDNVEVRAWHRTNNNLRVAVDPVKTDKNGLFRFQGPNSWGYLLYAHQDGQEIATAQDYYIYNNPQRRDPFTQTVFFTDRSLYRPGQIIQYKGICTRADQNTDQYETLAERNVTVVFVDHNNKEVARQQHRTNDYGSFSGSFTAPTGRVTGRMTIRVANAGEPPGAASVSVEEYKRPKFEVTVDKPKTPSKLNTVVTIDAKALAYTGAPIDHANVRYRVVRQTRFPGWWHHYYWWRAPQQPAQEIAHGATVTAVDGSFKVHFQATPDLSVPEKDEPIFRFTINADVTDSSGETRSGSVTINLGYTALQADITANDYQSADKAVSLKIKTATLDDEPQPANGTIKVYRLKEPDKVQRQSLGSQYVPRRGARGKIVDTKPEPDLSNPNSWPLGEVVVEKGFETDKTGTAKLEVSLPVGAYRATLETRDRYGKIVTALAPVMVLDASARQLAIKVPNVVKAPAWTLEPGKEFSALWGSGYDKARAYVEIEHRRQLLQAFWTDPARTQVEVKQAITEALRGGFTLRVTMVRENRAYLTARHVDVPWTNKDLSIRWEHFVSKLEPGQKQTWTAIITGPDAKKAVAEMVAALYDESLDAYLPHDWMKKFHVFRQDHTNVSSQFENRLQALRHLQGHFVPNYKQVRWEYRSFPADLTVNLWGYGYFQNGREGFLGGAAAPGMAKAGEREDAAELQADGVKQFRANAKGAPGSPPAPPDQPSVDVGKVSARKNLNETAFFFPNLVANKEGEVKLVFTMPEALTRWKFLGFAHDKDLRSGYLQDHVVTARDLMVQPNPPRFLREGDVLEFTVKVTNQSDSVQTGTVRLTLADARTGKSADAGLGNLSPDKQFEVPAKESRTYAWKLTVPVGQGFLTYKAVASTGTLADGEEGYLPVLSNRVLVTESLPLPIRGPMEKTFKFTRLLESGKSETLKSQSLTVQMASNPNWYAVMALPYLMEYPYQCTEQTFNRLYANALARHIANSDPKIRNIFNLWKNTPALDSPLEKNKDLLAVALEETPWLRQAQAESQARRNVGILFDDNRLTQETADLIRKLADNQYPDGAWPWFPGGPPNDYITLYITTGFGRMRHLGVKVDQTSALKSIARLDGWIDRIYRDILRLGRKDKNNLTATIALYLYGRSFFLEVPVRPEHKEAHGYFIGQAKEHWLALANRQSQAHLALALNRFGHAENAKGIMRSIKERSVTDEELGMFWRDQEWSWWWYRAPIETQAMMIEAFDEVMSDLKAVEECKVWLLKQKQTRDWKTTKATADACYALLLRGDHNPLASDVLVDIALAGKQIQPEKVEAGTGFFEERILGNDIKPDMGTITVKKVDKGVAWGSVHWQYLEDIGKVTAYEGTPLKLKKELFTRVYTKKGPVLYPVKDALNVGDEMVVRVILRVDRDMEYVHLKDARGSGTEPVNVLSKYRYQDGLAYYESTRDTGTHFFIDYLPKGTYVFEYSTRVVHRGHYQTGMAQIQCMYAPEFNSHSESFALTVR